MVVHVLDIIYISKAIALMIVLLGTDSKYTIQGMTKLC